MQNAIIPIYEIKTCKRFNFLSYRRWIDSKAYILKPIDPELLEEALLRSLREPLGNRIVVNSSSKKITLDLDKVLYFEINNKELYVHYTDSRSEVMRVPLREIKKLLPDDQFFQVHRSYIVSLPGIYAIEKREAVLTNKERIPVSKKNYNSLQEKLMEWYFKQSNK